MMEAGVGVLVVLIVVIASAAALPLVRRRHPGKQAFVTRVAVMFILPTAGVMVAPLVFLNEPPLLALMAQMIERGEDPNFGRGVTGLVLDSVYMLCWTLPAAVFAVGYGVRRTFLEALDRLGLVIPTRRTWLIALVATVAILAGVWLLNLVETWVWSRFSWPVTDERLVNVLFAHSFSVAGALTVGLTAGLGEEVVVRGILQPRVGVLLSNLAFTAVHAYQYHWDALVQVFLIGLALGLIRKHTDTTTTAIVHGGYDVVVLGFSAFTQAG
jgi:membrane protease YdiL (CAAX protease family)